MKHVNVPSNSTRQVVRCPSEKKETHPALQSPGPRPKPSTPDTGGPSASPPRERSHLISGMGRLHAAVMPRRSGACEEYRSPMPPARIVRISMALLEWIGNESSVPSYAANPLAARTGDNDVQEEHGRRIWDGLHDRLPKTTFGGRETGPRRRSWPGPTILGRPFRSSRRARP